MNLKRNLFILIFLLSIFKGQFSRAQTAPVNDDCVKAINLRTVNGYCSQGAEFFNTGATDSQLAKALEWSSAGKDVWFKFVATAYDVNINVKSGNGLGTLNNPQIAIYLTDCSNYAQEIGQFFPGQNQSTYYKGALTVGKTYYIRVSGANNATGTFQLCVDNYFPPNQPGQDYVNASLLCSKDAFTQTNVTGAGPNNRESQGTCLDIGSAGGSIEANTAWYKWIAANNGTLTFNIIPTNVNDDLDWVLYDLGTAANPKPVNASNAIRCAAGSGVTCSPRYYITGANESSTDFNEAGGCVPGQDGFVRFIDMQQDHLYALLINNFSTGNNGFRLEFGGTGEFQGPDPNFEAQNTFCDANYSTTYTLDRVIPGNTYEWDFGEGAINRTSNSTGPITVNYNGPGERVVTLKTTSPLGCSSYRSYAFADTGPVPPLLATGPQTYCVGDTLVLTPTNQPAGAEAVWTLPTGEEIISDVLILPLTSTALSGQFKMRYVSENCTGESTNMQITVLEKPFASFTVSPQMDQLFAAPITFNFMNNSQNASAYLWDFGDGSTSTLANPSHTYNQSGRYVIRLTAFNQQCSDVLTLPVLKILANGEILVPNTFTPNGDGNNDEFNILIANLKSYHIDIFNRYGSLLFSSNSILNSWDGTYKGKPVPVGVYYFIITAVDVADNKLFQKNSVTIIR